MASANATTNSLRNAARAAWSSLMILILFLTPQQLAEPVAKRSEDGKVQRERDAAYDGQTEIATLFGRRRLNAGLHHALKTVDEPVIQHGRYDSPEDYSNKFRK